MWTLGLLLALSLSLWIWRGRGWWQRRQRLAACGRLLPGPPVWPIIGNTFYIGMNLENAFDICVQQLKTHGNLFRVWITSELMLVVSNARDAEVVLSSTKYIEKSSFYYFFQRWLGTGLLTASGEKWHTRRKIITPTFHFKILESFIDIFDKNANILISKFRQKSGEPSFEVSRYIDLYTHDIICESAMGVELNAQIQQESEYLSAVKRQNEVLVKRSTRPWLYLDTFFQWSALGKESDESLTILHGMTDKVIRQRRKLLQREMETKSNGNKRYAFLDLLLLSSEGGQVLSDKDIREEVDTFMFEGHDTVSSTICFALYELSKNRGVQERIHEELMEVFRDGLSLSLESLSELKYTEMVIKETLRLYPSVPILARTLQEEMKLATKDIVVPPGAHVLLAPLGIHRDPEFYPDPEKFNPDNFLPDVVRERHPFAFVPFSAGPRNCIGQRFAMLELKSTIAKIVWNFIIEPSPTFSPRIVSGLTMKTLNGIEIMVTSRQK